MAEPVELTKKLKEFLKDDMPYVRYRGIYHGQPVYEVSSIPFEEYEYSIQGSSDYCVPNPKDLSQSRFVSWADFAFEREIEGDPDYVPEPDPLATPVELSKQLKAYLKDSYRYIRYLGRYEGHPAYEISNKDLSLLDFTASKYCVVFNNDIAQLKYFDWCDVEFLDNIQYARYYEDI